jgi:hypothetical protein
VARRVVAAWALIAAFLICSAPTSAQVQPVGERKVAPGLTTFLVKLPQPNVAYVAKVARGAADHVRVATTGRPGVTRAPTSDLCGDCLVAVNGGFFDMGTGLPVAGQSPAALAALLDPARRSTVHTVQWLVKDGKTWPFADTSFALGRHPRTFIFGNGRATWLAAVDGRQPGYSLGMSLPEVVAFARAFGASWVVNLDGGCSTTFVVGGVVKNQPCRDATTIAGERPVANAIVVMP